MDKNIVKTLLQDQNNTRNFGHLRTADGRALRPDIIRSNMLSREKQISCNINQSLKTIVDLRITEEGGGDENEIFSSATIISLPILFGNLSPKKIGEWLMLGEIEKIDSFLENGYLEFTTSFGTQIKTFFELITEESNLPLAFHCSAGKDRTGTLAALFLLALGVSKEDVIADYMETNNRIKVEETAKKIAEHFDNNTEMVLPHPEKSQEALKLLLGVKLRWIEIFLEGIDRNFGGVDRYLEDELQVDLHLLRKIYIID
ncbi:MAG: tyrosine-protein phosphatase [Bacteriovoracaceae bacterium]|nr:tyrosine-protein phosphatase [Bacteriovoracaceae bacterium]